MVLVAEVVLREQVWVLRQRGPDLLLLLEASRVGDFDVPALGGRFIHDLLQPGIELAVHVVCRGAVVAQVLFVSRVAAVFSRDLIQNFWFRLFLTGEGQLPPAGVSHGTGRDED